MSDVHILPAVAIDIGGIDTHTGLIFPIFTRGDAGDQRHIVESSIVLVNEKEIRPRIIRNGDVGPAVVVEVGEYDAHSFGFRLANSRGFAHVGEGSIVVIVIKLDVLAFVISRMTVGTVSRTAFATP